MEPDTRYAVLDGNRIAYQVVGDGPVDLVASQGSYFTVDSLWGLPEALAPYLKLSTRCRLILFDRLGTGWSDAVPLDSLPPIEARWAEIAAVMDAAGSERAVLFGRSDGGYPAMHGAATHPDRVAGLILFHPAARYRLDADYPIGIDDQTWEHWKSYMADWDVDTLLSVSYPSRAGDDRFMQWGRRYIRSMATPAAMLAYVEASWHTDVRDLLPLIEVPTLVMNRRDGQWASGEMARFVAEHIPGAQYREFPGGDSDIFFEESSSIVDAMTTFIAEIGPVGASSAPSERMMATILFTDIVASTERAQSSGDSDWSRLLQVHDDLSADIVNRHSGRLVKSTGDGILALFDGPGRGLVAARDLCAAMNGIGLPIRAGLHAGEVEIRGDDVAGIGVNIASRVMAAAGPDAILVSRTVRDLVAGSQFRFDSRGSHELKGVDGQWELWALVGG